jgi:hypothetical protein
MGGERRGQHDVEREGRTPITQILRMAMIFRACRAGSAGPRAHASASCRGISCDFVGRVPGRAILRSWIPSRNASARNNAAPAHWHRCDSGNCPSSSPAPCARCAARVAFRLSRDGDTTRPKRCGSDGTRASFKPAHQCLAEAGRAFRDLRRSRTGGGRSSVFRDAVQRRGREITHLGVERVAQ